MTKLSVNINKIALLRNSRGSNLPDVKKAALDCIRFGAEGITVHPRPDERHIRYKDVVELKPIINVELNVEGYPSKEFMSLVEDVKPAQVTLVPDAPDAITSNAGWDTVTNKAFLKEIIARLKNWGIRTSLFVDTNLDNIEGAAAIETDRIELYTEDYAKNYKKNQEEAISAYIKAAHRAHKYNLGINAGHDLNLDNLAYFHKHIEHLAEVSIGHALISDALYLGLENTIQLYLRQLK